MLCGSNFNCVLAVVKLIPLASIPAHAISFVDDMCAAGQLHRAGLEELGWATFMAGLLEFAKAGLKMGGIDFHVMHELQALLSASDCANRTV